MIKFIHLRLHEDGELCAEGGITIAYKIENNLIKYSLAKCHWRDNYNKKRGRDISMGKKNKNVLVITLPCLSEIYPKSQITDNIYQSYISNGYEQLTEILY